MKYAFHRPTHDPGAWPAITESLNANLSDIRRGDYSLGDLHDFCTQAALDARPLKGKRDMLF